MEASSSVRPCSKCKENPSRGYHPYCAKCHSDSVKASNRRTGYRSPPSSKKRKRAYDPEYYKARYREIHDKLIAYKLEHGCKDCGYDEHHAGLEFDHLAGFEKVASPTTFAGRGWNSVLAEIKKCEVVCSRCHSIRTWERRQQN